MEGGGGAGWPRERTTSLYYKKGAGRAQGGPKDVYRADGLFMAREVSSSAWCSTCICELRAIENHCCPGVIDTGAMAPVTSPCRSGYIGGLVCHYGGRND